MTMKKLSKKDRVSEERSYTLSSDVQDLVVAQLVDIDFYPRMSEETLAFNATLHLQVGALMCSYDCSNDGHGGSTTIRPHCVKTTPEQTTRYNETLRKWNEYLSTQRDDKFYEVAAQMGWNVADMKSATKSAEGEVDNMLADWCDKHNL